MDITLKNPDGCTLGNDRTGEDADSGGGTDSVDRDVPEQILKLDAGVELADLDVSAGAGLSQKFVLSIEDMEYQLRIEGALAAAGDGTCALPSTSRYTDTDGRRQINHELKLTPKAERLNDTRAGLHFGCQRDLLKE